MELDAGYVQVYTGEGKGKTTASLGQAIRAKGAGLEVRVIQFIKGNSPASSEVRVLELLDIMWLAFGDGKIYHNNNISDECKACVKAGWLVTMDFIRNNKCDVLILDELNIAIHFGLISKDQVLSALSVKPPSMEIIITGRHAPQWLIEVANLVSTIDCTKHYFNDGIMARKGIEL